MKSKTLVIIKPDAVHRGLVGEIIARFERVGLTIRGLKITTASKELALEHYSDLGEKYGEDIQRQIAGSLTLGPIVVLSLTGIDAVPIVRKMIGSTYPNEAAPGTIRGDYAHVSKAHSREHDVAIYNLVHSSASDDEAKKETLLWFTKEELVVRLSPSEYTERTIYP